MPTYQYACKNPSCGNEFELVQSFADAAADECPVCAGPVRKVFGAVGVVFKGSGFYRTDSRASSTKTEANGSGSTEKKAEDKSKSEAKPKPATETKPAASGSGSAGKAAASA
jgi:putative FmdB family regulatory protein